MRTSYAVVPGSTVEVSYTALNRVAVSHDAREPDAGGHGRRSRARTRTMPRSSSNQPVNAQLKYTVPADQPYSQPFWLREPKQRRHLHDLATSG